jgi:hypothetical protein
LDSARYSGLAPKSLCKGVIVHVRRELSTRCTPNP